MHAADTTCRLMLITRGVTTQTSRPGLWLLPSALWLHSSGNVASLSARGHADVQIVECNVVQSDVPLGNGGLSVCVWVVQWCDCERGVDGSLIV
jgi:hypothetical protein